MPGDKPIWFTNPMPATLQPEDLAAIAAMLAAPPRTDRILTREEAMAYTKHESESAFYRWCTRWRVTSAAAGRYARGHLDSALDREASRRRAAKPAPRRPALAQAA